MTGTDEHDSLARTALILYGSETGNAQDVAEEVGRMAERLRFDATVLDMDSVQLRDLVKHTVVVFAISTTGQGEMPQNARKFWKTLLSGALKPGILRRLRFSCFGIGDSSYARYNVAGRLLCNRLMQLGGKSFLERGEGNEQHPEGHSAGFREWIVSLQQSLINTFPLPEGVDPYADDVFLEPKWKLKPVGESVTATNEVHQQTKLSGIPPSRTPIPVKGAHAAELVANDRVTASDHFQDVRLLDFRLEDSVDYGPGAVAVIYPKNWPEDVAEFIDLMQWQNIANHPLDLEATTIDAPHALSPLRHLDLSQVTLTMRWLLENVLDIMSIPRRSFFASLAYFSNDKTEDDKYQKERLLELANPELIDELWDYTTRPKRTILEVMMDFTTIKIPWQYALSAIPMMKGRQFSIASGGSLRQDDQRRTRVQLLVAIANPPSPIIKWRRRYGVCTRYIASLEIGQRITIGMQPGYLDVQPGELEVPVVMIGPGTGVAPMRSMIHQRQLWSAQDGKRGAGDGLQDDTLIFGCRSPEADYFFKDEWARLTRTEGLSIAEAFSRDKDQPKKYVQDKIRENGQFIHNKILQRNGKIYLSGSSGNMPKGVREALTEVLIEHGSMQQEDAERYLETMEREGRFKQETW